MISLSFEERKILKQLVSAKQLEKEMYARSLEIVVLYEDEVINMGGGSRHWSEQIRSGYPSSSKDRDKLNVKN